MSRRPLRSEYMVAIECKDMKKNTYMKVFPNFYLTLHVLKLLCFKRIINIKNKEYYGNNRPI